MIINELKLLLDNIDTVHFTEAVIFYPDGFVFV